MPKTFGNLVIEFEVNFLSKFLWPFLPFLHQEKLEQMTSKGSIWL